MATIVKRGKTYYVVYLYTNEHDERKQKWESYKTMEEAKKRRLEIEYKKDIGSFIIPQCRTLEELLQEYVNLYGKNTWALSTYESNIRLMDNYIIPSLGGVKLQDLTPRVMEKYYQTLLKTEAVPRKRFGWKEELSNGNSWRRILASMLQFQKYSMPKGRSGMPKRFSVRSDFAKTTG